MYLCSSTIFCKQKTRYFIPPPTKFRLLGMKSWAPIQEGYKNNILAHLHLRIRQVLDMQKQFMSLNSIIEYCIQVCTHVYFSGIGAHGTNIKTRSCPSHDHKFLETTALLTCYWYALAAALAHVLWHSCYWNNQCVNIAVLLHSIVLSFFSEYILLSVLWRLLPQNPC